MSPSHPTRKPRGLLLAALALMATLLPLANADSARAGTMTHWVCAIPDAAGNLIETTNNTEGWSFNSAIFGGVQQPSCSSWTPLGLRLDATNVQPFAANSGRMWWTYSAPAGTTIAEAHLMLAGEIWAGNDSNAHLMLATYRGAPNFDPEHTLTTCERYYGCNHMVGWHHAAINAQSWWATYGCAGGGTCGGGNRGYFIVSHGSMILRDDRGPVPGLVTGTLVSDAAQAGQRTLLFNASDEGVGVADVEIKIGGKVVVPRQPIDTNGGRCIPKSGGYLYPQPCRLSVPANITVDTTKASEGRQTLNATIWDAAGNAATVVNREITVDNVPPPVALRRPSTTIEKTVASVGDVVTADDGQWSGDAVKISRRWQRSADGETWTNIDATQTTYRLDDADLGKFVRVVVTASNAEGTTTAASFTPDGRIQQQGAGIKGPPAPGSAPLIPTTESGSGPNGSSGNLSTGRLVNSRKSRTLKVSYGRKAKITGRLIDSAGHPITGATLDVYETRNSAGSVRTKAGSITTNDKGEYEYRPKTTASKKIDLAYAGTFGGAGYTDTLTVSLEVRAWVTLKTSRKSARRGSPVRLFGRVHGELPKRGVLVQLRALTGTEVIEFQNRRTDSKGRFSYVRRFKNAGPFYFRAKMFAAGDVALASGESKVVKLRIR